MTDTPQTPFPAWRARMGFTAQDAAFELGIHTRTVQRYDAGAPVPKPILLACRYLQLVRDIASLLPPLTPNV